MNYKNESLKFLEKTRQLLIGMNECIDDIKISIELKHNIMQIKNEVSKVL